MTSPRRLFNLALAALMTCAACSPPVPTPGPNPQVTPASEPKSDRIVSLSPANTEILFAIGVGKRIVGVTSFCDFPPAVDEIDEIGGFAASSISLEKIIALGPDLVVAAGPDQAAIVDELNRRKIRSISVYPQSIDEIFTAIEDIGGATGERPAALKLTEEMKGRLQDVESRLDSISKQERLSVFYQLWDQPLMTAGAASFVGEMIRRAGGVNVFADDDAQFPQVNEELVLQRDPAVILVPSGKDGLGQRVLDRAAWKDVAAVRQGRVHPLDADLLSRPGPRVVDGVEQIARALYPAAFSD